MAVPAFLNSTYFYNRIIETDMTTVATNIGTFLVSTCGWTDSGGGLYTSPTDAAGRYIDVLITDRGVSGSNDRIEFRVRDSTPTTICTRRCQAPTANSWDVRYYGGSHHFWIDFINLGVQGQRICGGMLDLSPESQTAHTHWAWGTSNTTTADSALNGNWYEAFIIDNAAAATTERINRHCAVVGSFQMGSTAGGSYYIGRPLEFWGIPSGGGNNRYAGRAYQMLVFPATAGEPGGTVVVPIDTGTNGTFTLVGGCAISSNGIVGIRTA